MAYGSDIPTSRGTQGQSSNGKDTVIKIGDVTFVDDTTTDDSNETNINENVQTNLYTDGSEFKLEDGTPYVGSYHIHPDKGPMVGALHVSSPHEYLFPLSENLILGDIVFSKTIFSKNTFNKNINISFNELNQTAPPIDLSAFFRMYSNLFFDIPKEGEQSHNSIIKQSTDYIRDYIDPKDEVIRDLEEQIRQLELELAEDNTEQEHPVFKNGTMIRTQDEGWYYMDKGYRRYINWNTEMVDAIKLSLYGDLSGDQIPFVTKPMLENIPQGFPNLSEDNFGEEFNPRLNEVNNKIGYLRFIYDEDGLPSIDPRDYGSPQDFFEALNEDILQKKEVLTGVNRFISQLSSQINQLRVLDPNYYNETYGSSSGNGNSNNENGDNGNNGRLPAGNY